MTPTLASWCHVIPVLVTGIQPTAGSGPLGSLDTWDEPKTNGNGNGHGQEESSDRTPLRCIVTTPMNVTCSPDLRRDLVDSLGIQGFRFLSAGEG